MQFYQEEYQFSVNQVDPKVFSSLFKRTRNILFVGYGSGTNFYSNNNVYANPQKTITILGENKEDLLENINSHQDELIAKFKNSDLKFYQRKLSKDIHQIEEIKFFDKQGFSLKIPLKYKKVEETENFIWYRKNTIQNIMLNIVAYEIPYTSKEEFNISNIIKVRDSIGEKYIPGQFEGTYMLTESQYKPITKEVIISDKKAMEARGLWIVKNDFMGGPFLSYTFNDKKNNRLIIIEGFSYSPSVKKRDYVFELEAILKTFSIE